MKFIFIALLISLPSLSHAYIPPYWMIMSRVAENHGKGAYRVEQDVIFPDGDEPLMVTERWTILNEDSMRLEVTGQRSLRDKVRLTYVYKNGRKYFVEESGLRKSEKIPAGFTEHFFHFRASKNIKPLLVNLSIAPAISLKSAPHKYSQQKPLPDPEPYVRLSRAGGVINYAVGTPTPTSSTESYPGLWIEQDQFVIRRIRLPNDVQIDANQYGSYSGALLLPRERTYSWSQKSAKIVLNKAEALSPGPKLKETLEPSSLDFGKSPEVASILPESEVIKNFYSNLR